MTLRDGCLKRAAGRIVCLIACCFISPIFSQSLEDLESEVLGNGQNVTSDSQSNPPPVVEEEMNTSKTTTVKTTKSTFTSKSSSTSNSDSSDLGDDDVQLGSKGTSKEADSKVYKDVDDFISGPKSIPFKHIFVVKHQYIFKKGRHEIIPFTIGIQPGDSYRKQISMGGSYLYHLSEEFSIEAVHFNFFTNLESGFSKKMTQNVGLELERVEPVLSLGSALHWAPFQGKAATAENIYHFEGYLFAGGGITKLEVGSSPMIMGGAGARMFLNRHSTLKFEVRDYYELNSNTGNRLNILLGAGILLGAAKL